MARTEAGRLGLHAVAARLRARPRLMAAAQHVRTLGALGRALATQPPSECPCCGATARFLPVGSPPRLAARCPRCGSLERHRLLALAVQRGAVKVDGQRVLHFAPEAPVRRVMEPMAAVYRTADLSLPQVDHRVDVQSTGLPNGSFDVIVCSHVLEHVIDDRLAMRELRRILRPDGVLATMVPFVAEWESTYEPPDVTTPAQRTVHFGQGDHVRWYGSDFSQRLAAAGFGVERVVAGPVDAMTYALVRGDTLFLARPAGG